MAVRHFCLPVCITLTLGVGEALDQAILKSEALFRQPNTRLKDMDASAILKAFQGDKRLMFCDADVLFSTPIGKLAAKHGLVTSNGSLFMCWRRDFCAH